MKILRQLLISSILIASTFAQNVEIAPTDVGPMPTNTVVGRTAGGTGQASAIAIAPSATIDTTNAANITSGLLPDARLNNTAVTPGAYTSANVTIDAHGRVTLAANGSSGGLPTSNSAYVMPTVTASPTTNGTNLLAAYAAAILLTPNGSALSATNRAFVILPPAIYDLGSGGQLVVNTNYVDIVGLTSEAAAQVVTSAQTTASHATFNVGAGDVRFYNLDIIVTGVGPGTTDTTTPAAFFPLTNQPAHVMVNVITTAVGNNYAMRIGVGYTGYYKDCVSGTDSWGYNGYFGGVAINCTGDYAFGSGTGAFQGTCYNCIATGLSFGGASATGTCYSCTAAYLSRCATCSGNYYNCIGGQGSFGGVGTFTGLCIDCIGQDACFGGVGTMSGTCISCVANQNSFGSGVAVTSTARIFNCHMNNAAYAPTSVDPAAMIQGMTDNTGTAFSFSTHAATTVGTNQPLAFAGTGTAGVVIHGTGTNDSAAAGSVGEYVSSLVPLGSPVSLTNNTPANITSISLTAGDWDVMALPSVTETTSTVTERIAGISLTSATIPSDGSEGYNSIQSTVTSEVNSIPVTRVRISVASTTTVYLVEKVIFSAGTAGGFGSLNARRVR